ncbi:Hypothetical protein GLP15_788 [Giardia lamblia P15]|uniref:Leucine-rich repeat protein n=1 Tax=Giardia intestinalis (strain P15) TaxID=658858 RepID=E1EXW6_GIAIA|nr:Hypothetical protein GLP15_788 [Giardia lamblia P15]
MNHVVSSMAGPMVRILQLPSGKRTALVRNQCLTTPSSIILTSICDTLDLSHNDITVWPKWSSADVQPTLFQSITNLILSYNSLKHFNAPLKNVVPLLTGLSLRGTNIEELSELKYGIRGLKNLRCLDICETPLWEQCTDADKQYNMVVELSNSCRALQVVSGVRVTLAHRKYIRTSK